MLVGLFAFKSSATTHYASPTGTAGYIVSSPTSPMTLLYAYNSCAAGDSLLLEGTFTLTQNLYVSISDLYIGEYGTGATLQGDYDNTTAGFPLITLRYPTNVTVENLTFANHFGNGARGILAWGSGDNLLIQNNVFTNIGWNTSATEIPTSSDGANAIIVLGNVNSGSLTNVNILGNAVTNCITGFNESITVIGNVDGFVVANNYISDVTNIGIDAAGHFSWVADYDPPYDALNASLNQARNGVIRNNTVIRAISLVATSAGLYCDGCADVVFERNLVKESGAGISIGCEVGGGNTASGVTVINNIFRDNLESGMFLGSLASESSAQGASSVDNCVVRNNTFYQNCQNDGVTSFNDYEIFLQNSNNNVFNNNIISMLNTAKGIVAAGTSDVVNFDMDYNLFYRADLSEADLVISSATSTLSGNENSQYGDPGFTSISGDIFNISTTGRAANAGDPATTLLTGELDRDGGARIQGSIADIGAQESASTQSAPTPNTEFAVPTTFVPDPNKTYYIDNPHHGVRLAATGISESAYTTSTITTLDDVVWKFVDKGNGYWHLDRAGGGTKPRLRTDNTANADMQATSSTGAYTYFEMTPSTISGLYYFTLPDAPASYKRLQVNNSGDVKMVSTASVGTWESFSITEVGGTATTTVIDDEDFESGWGIWNDGGSDAVRLNSSSWANSGTFSIRLRDNTGTSVMTTDNLDLSSYSSLNISLSYITSAFNSSSEDFWLQVSTDGGTSFVTVNEWNLNDEFVNNTRYFDTIELIGSFTSTTKFRFRCDASANNDLLYIDDVVLEGISTSGARAVVSSFTEELQAEMESFNLSVYPNPSSDVINVSGIELGQTVRVFNMSGNVILETSDTKINVSNFKTGVYFVKTQGQDAIRFVKE